MIKTGGGVNPALHFCLTSWLCLLAQPAAAGGFACDMTFECRGNFGCDEVSYQPYVDMRRGQIVMKHYGPEIKLESFAPENSDVLKVFAHLPEGGLFVVVIDDETSNAVFTSFLPNSRPANVVTVFGTCGYKG